jgi:hypothetical protein
VQPAAALDQLVAGPEKQVIRVAEHNLGPGGFDVAMQHRLDRPLRADGHEGRGLDAAVRRLDAAEARPAVGGGERETEGRGHQVR